MRSSTLVSAALSCLGLCLTFSSIAHGADPKGKKKGSGDALTDDKVISKQMQWEEKVMGEDDGKKSELDKILKAQAINKAATEKAEREKAEREKQAAKEAAKEAAAPKAKKNSEVSIGALPDEGPSKGSSKAKATEISPKLESAEAATPPPPPKPADDKFIDKLLKDDGGPSKKKKASASDDRALQDLLAGDAKNKPAVKGKGKRSDVDSLLENADKEPEVVTTKVKHETPEWAKPEIQSTPAVAAPVPVVAPRRRDDGIIRVVQGAAGGAGAKPIAPPPAEPVASRPVPASPNRKQPNVPAARTGRSGGWDDPFATDSAGSKKTTASRAVRPSADDDFAAAPARKNVASRPAADDDLFAPPAKRNASASQPARRGGASWDDPFADGGSRTVPAKRTTATVAPVRPAKSEPAPRASGGSWKDPFTDDSAAARPVRRAAAPTAAEPARTSRKSAVVARETSPAKEDKWATAQHGSDDGDASATQSKGRWGILKKQRTR